MDLQSQRKFADELVKYVLSRTAGTHERDEIINERPGRKYIIGTLAAKKEKELPLKEEEESRASIRAQRSKVSFLASKNTVNSTSEIVIHASGNVYYQIEIEQKENDTPRKEESNNLDIESNQTEENNFKSDSGKRWKRLSFSHKWTSKLSPNIESIDFSQARAKANSDPLLRKQISADVWKGEISVQVDDFDKNNFLITIYYRNTALEPKKPDNFERTLFDCRLTANLNGFSVNEFSDEYFYEGHKQKYYYDFRSINCQAYWEAKGRKFYTTHYGYFEQDNISPKRSITGINLTFSALMSEYTAITMLGEFVNKMKSNLQEYRTAMPLSFVNDDFQLREGNKQRTWGEKKELIDQFEHTIYRIENGVELIKSDQKIREAFLKTNETFSNYYSNKGILDAGWRLFQLAFLLASMESVVRQKNLDTADVLHVDTGGGKSEAYFALVIFTAFYERIIGKSEGVSAIVKFPLRMLSIQQLERISSIIIHAEAVRELYKNLFSGTSFSLGYYVGNSDEFPDLYKKVKNKLSSKGSPISPAPESLIISKCPLCSLKDQGTVRIYDDPTHGRVIHKCDKCNKEFHIFISDRELFRWRPTVIVSTVDKWAALSQQRRARNLLGAKGSMCPDGHGFIPSGDKCEDRKDEEFQCQNVGEKQKSVDGPRLSIQDEMHLLSEGFGTISSHFEGLIEAIVEETSGRSLKHITMSATLNGTKNQIDELYRKKAFIIPGRCPEGIGSPKDFFFEKQEGPKRIIYGLKPNLRDNHYASLRTLLHFAEFMLDAQSQLNSDSAKFCEKYSISDPLQAQALINQYLIPLTYHIKKQDAYDMERLKDAVVGDSLRKNNNADMGGIVLTGDSSLEELKKAIDNVRSYIRNYDPKSVNNGNFIFEPIYATSVVSHGVDLEELNFMIFQGLPYSTSEYIQALSRVGRKQLGVVLLWFYPNRVRDDSFYRNFTRYHETLDHQVKPIPINRFSRLGLYQTVNSLFCAGIINYLSDQKGKPLYHKEDIVELNLDDQNKLINFIKRIYKRDILDIDVSQEVEDRLNQIKNSRDGPREFFPNILANSGEYFFRNQSGMRGIQRQLILGLIYDDYKKINQKEI